MNLGFIEAPASQRLTHYLYLFCSGFCLKPNDNSNLSVSVNISSVDDQILNQKSLTFIFSPILSSHLRHRTVPSSLYGKAIKSSKSFTADELNLQFATKFMNFSFCYKVSFRIYFYCSSFYHQLKMQV